MKYYHSRSNNSIINREREYNDYKEKDRDGSPK